MARPLGVCPTCRRGLPPGVRAEMCMRGGVVLNALCPGACGPSDVDHVIHSDTTSPERVMFLEYKDTAAPAEVPAAQRRVFDSLAGEWRERRTGRLLTVGYAVLRQHEPDPVAALRPAVDRVWPERDRRDLAPVLDHAARVAAQLAATHSCARAAAT